MELKIEGTPEEQFAVMRSAVIQMHGTLKGNGQDGLETKFEKLCTKIDGHIKVEAAVREERIAQAAKQNTKLNVVIGIVGVIAAIGLVIVSFIGIEVQSHHSLLQQLEAGSNTYQYAKFERTTK